MKFNVKIAPERRKDKEGAIIGKNVPIFIDIRFAGNRLAYFTGYRIDTDNFDTDIEGEETPQAIGDGTEGGKIVKSKVINKRLKGINTRVNTYFEDNPREVSKKDLKKVLDIFCGKHINEVNIDDDNSFLQCSQNTSKMKSR